MNQYNLFQLFSMMVVLSCTNPNADKEGIEHTPPNILFILSDDHTAQAWGIYGGILEAHVQNKHIQRLAREGMILNNAFCTNSICVPSRASIMTGQYSHENHIYTLSESLHPDSNNIAKTLQNTGYQTAIIGKWHLKKEPTGFDYYAVLPGQGVYDNPVLKTKENWEDGHAGGEVYQGFSTDVIGDFSIDWLKQRDPKKPFFLMTQFKATHGPFDYPSRYDSLYKGISFPEPKSLYDFDQNNGKRTFPGQPLEEVGKRMEYGSTHPDSYWGKAPGLPVSFANKSPRANRKAIYQKLIGDFLRSGAAIDDNIGKLLAYLESEDILDNTVIIYTSDQGYFLGEHGFFDKRLMYEPSLRMPFVIRYPKEIKGGSRLDDLILNVDFPALICDFANTTTPSSFQGKSFRSNLKGETPKEWRKSIYYRYWLHEAIRPAHFGIRNDRYKLIFFYGQPLGMPGTSNEPTTPTWEFYDLQKDPKERNNAYHDPNYKSLIKEMKAELLALRKNLNDTDTQYPVMDTIFKKYWD